jgi:hypothetical protein
MTLTTDFELIFPGFAAGMSGFAAGMSGFAAGNARSLRALFRWNAVDFDLDVVIQVIDVVAIGPGANVLAFGLFAADETAMVGFDVRRVFTGAFAQGIIIVIIEDDGAGFEFRIIADFDEHVFVDPGLFVEVPDGDGRDGGWRPEVELHPLLAGPELDERPVGSVLIAVRDEGEVADGWGGFAGGDILLLGEQGGALADTQGLDGFAGGFEIFDAAYGNRCANELGFGEFNLEFFLGGVGESHGCGGGNNGEGGGQAET